MILEARVAELEAEVAEWRRMDLPEAPIVPADALERIRNRLRQAYLPSGGQMSAIMLNALLVSSRPVNRDRLFALTREPGSWASDEGDRKGIDVQLCKLRKALANMGFPQVIQTMSGRGWMIDEPDSERIKAALGV